MVRQRDREAALPLDLLCGPRASRLELSRHRLQMHDNWAMTASAIQSGCPRDREGHPGPVRPDEFPLHLVNRHRAVNAQAYGSRAPDMREDEVVTMLTSWFGAPWPGIPALAGIEPNYSDDVDNGRGGIPACAKSLRFLTRELAREFTLLSTAQGCATRKSTRKLNVRSMPGVTGRHHQM